MRYSAGSSEIAAFLGDAFVNETRSPQNGCRVVIDLGTGDTTSARHGEWIIKAHGYIHVMPDDQFKREFRPA